MFLQQPIAAASASDMATIGRINRMATVFPWHQPTRRYCHKQV